MPEPAVAEPATDPGEITLKTFGDISPDAFDKVFPSSAAERVATEPVTTPEPATPAATVPATEPAAAPKPAVEGEVPDEIFGTPPAAAPAATPPKPEVEVPKSIKDPKAIENWKQLRTAYDESNTVVTKQAAEIAVLRQKAEAAVADEGMKARLTQLETENKTLREKATAADIQSDEGFQQHFVAGRQNLVATAAAVAKRAGVEPGVVESAMALSGDQRIQALDEITESITSPTLKTQLSNLAGQIESLDQQKAAVLADSQGSWTRLQEQRKAENYQRQQQTEKIMSQKFDGAVEHLAKLGWEIFKEFPGDENHWWNKQRVQAIESAREYLLKTSDQDQIAMGPAMMVAAPIYRGLYLKTREALIKERKENAELRGAEPGLNGRQREDSASETALDKNLGFAESAARGSGLP